MPTSPASAIDPVFAEVAKAIYGDVDVREIAKFSPGGSDLHASGPMTPEQRARREKKVAQTGVGATTVATAGGLHALSATRHEHLQRMANAGSEKAAAKLTALKTKTEAKQARRVARVGNMKGPAGKVLRTVAANPKRAAIAAGTGWAGLHAVELGADALAFRAQAKTIKQANKDIAAAQGKKPVAKAFRLRPLNTLPDQVPSLRAKRVRMNPLPANPHTKRGVFQPVSKIGPHLAADYFLAKPNPKGQTLPAPETKKKTASKKLVPVSKGLRSAVKGVKATVRNVRDTAGHAENASRDAAETAAKIKVLIPTRRQAALMGVGTVGALTGATYAGTRAGSYAGTRPARKQVKKSVETDVTWTALFSKVDTDKRQVFGWASVSQINGQDVVDLQGDIVPIEEIEKSAYQYVIDSRKGGDMHRRVSKLDDGTVPHHTADMIESFVVTPEKLEKMGLPSDALPLGWWVGYHVNDDEQWSLVKSGARAGFSIHGSGKRTAVSKADDGKRRGLALKERTRQAVHPPPVKLKRVDSSAIDSMGYQKQTRRLAVEMHSNLGRPYQYRLKPKEAQAALDAPSLGRHYATKIRGKAKPAKGYTPADRVRLFVHPQVSKRLMPIRKVTT